jgi:hypothetical protein
LIYLYLHLHLGLPSGLFHSAFPYQTPTSFLLSPIRATCPTHLILHYYQPNLVRSNGHEAPCHGISSSPLVPLKSSTFLNNPLTNALTLCSPLNPLKTKRICFI